MVLDRDPRLVVWGWEKGEGGAPAMPTAEVGDDKFWSGKSESQVGSWVFHWSLEHILHTLMLKHSKSNHLTWHPSVQPTISHMGKPEEALHSCYYPFSMAAAVSFQSTIWQVTAFALWKELPQPRPRESHMMQWP